MTLRSNTPDCPLRNRRALSPGFRIKKPLIWTHTRPTTNNPIHTCCFYLCWLLCFYLFITLYFTASAPSPFHSCSHTFIMSPPAQTFTLPGRLISPALHSTLADEVRRKGEWIPESFPEPICHSHCTAHHLYFVWALNQRVVYSWASFIEHLKSPLHTLFLKMFLHSYFFIAFFLLYFLLTSLHPFFSDLSLPSRYFLLNSLKHLVCLFGFHYLIIGFSFILILHSPQFPSLPAQAVIFQCEPSKSALAWIFWRNVSVHFRIHMWSVLNPGHFRCFLQLMLIVTLL